MKTFTAYASTTIFYYDENDNLIGEDNGHRPVYELSAPNLSTAKRAGKNRWSYTGDSNGTTGATWYGDYGWDDIYDEEVRIDDIYDIEECSDW